MSAKTKAAVGERLPYLLAKLKAPRVLERLQTTAQRARDEDWPYEQFLEALLEAEVFARDASGARQRVRHAAFPAHKTLEDFDFTAQQWVDRLDGAQHRNSLDDELRRLDRYRLLVIDEIGYLPLERQAANLLFALIARRYERGSIIVTSNRGFEHWGEILGDAMVAAALIDRLVHHATMITLKGKSYRLRERGTGVTPTAQAPSLRDSA